MMPVSHLGLTVTHIPSATSFYLAALQPLGYRYIGQQGESIGLGIKDADFFLCQEQNGTRVSPTHIAFAADTRMAVRNCYAAALNAGARPSGAPSYRNNDCSCFNAAVEDQDGNTIEFIVREPCSSGEERALPAPSGYGQVQKWQDGGDRSAAHDDTESFASKPSRTSSRAQTALDLASTTSKSMRKSRAPSPTLTRSRTEPVRSSLEDGGKKFVGTLLGAAAGAAVAYAMCQSERDGARDETEFARSRAYSGKNSRPPSNYERSTVSNKSHRDYTTTMSARTSQRPYRNMLPIEAPNYDDDDDNVIEQAKSRYTSSRRPQFKRSRTHDVTDYPSRSNISDKDDYISIKRASTLPLDPHDYYGGSRTAPASRHTSRRGSFEDTHLKRHDSGISMQSHRSRRSSASKASTAKPFRRGSQYDSAANVPLPSSKATSYIPASQVPIPPSRINSRYTDAAEESDGLGDMKTVVPEDSISCVDFSTKSSRKSKPSSSNKSSRRGSKHSEADSERTVRPAKPSVSRHSAQTLPTRSKDDYNQSRSGRRSAVSYV